MKKKVIYTILIFFVVTEVYFIYTALHAIPFSLKKEVFIYQYGEPIDTDADYYVNCSERLMESVKLNISEVNTDVGSYPAVIEFFGEEYPFTIEVVDTIKPKVKLKQSEFTINQGTKLIAKDLLEEIEDASLTKVYFYNDIDEAYSLSRTFKTIGDFVERIVVEDEYGNQSASLRVMIKVCTNSVPPVLKGVDDVTIKVGQNFDSLKGVTAHDDLDGDLTSKVRVEGSFDTSEKGTYELTYRVEDLNGNKTDKVRKVVVE